MTKAAIQREIEHCKTLVEKAEAAQAEYQAALRAAVRALSAEGLSYADIGWMLGISKSRAAQLGKRDG